MRRLGVCRAELRRIEASGKLVPVPARGPNGRVRATFTVDEIEALKAMRPPRDPKLRFRKATRKIPADRAKQDAHAARVCEAFVKGQTDIAKISWETKSDPYYVCELWFLWKRGLKGYEKRYEREQKLADWREANRRDLALRRQDIEKARIEARVSIEKFRASMPAALQPAPSGAGEEPTLSPEESAARDRVRQESYERAMRELAAGSATSSEEPAKSETTTSATS